MPFANGARYGVTLSESQTPLPNFVDLHAHYLPAIDDGSPDIETSLKMTAAAVDMGFSHLVATPHQRAGMYMPSAEQIAAAATALKEALAQTGGGLRLDVAAENFWDGVFHDRLADRTVPSYPGNKAFLFEVEPSLMPPRIEDVLFQIRVAGYLPVMAHPERYRAIRADLTLAEKLGRSAALLVDLAALDGSHGWTEKRVARRLVEEGLAHAAATDMHTLKGAKQAAAGLEWIRKRMGDAACERLLGESPRRILAGDLP
ncbi:MAG: CpsB/CapC family capsule biosynthesis tyrosine phosphatase [Deltaproteobacteria bacterium]|nr:CpsB/CapC family capsule biosynthesis tyrosine phosphatase [Deltaproteobacteria bacterium]